MLGLGPKYVCYRYRANALITFALYSASVQTRTRIKLSMNLKNNEAFDFIIWKVIGKSS